MKKYIFSTAIVAGLLCLPVSCIEEIDPQSSTVTVDQAAGAPGAYDNFVSAITSSMNGQPTYSGDVTEYAIDFGYPTFMVMRDAMGQDMVINANGNDWYVTWYSYSRALGPTYAYCQFPWTCFYGWINNCNNVIRMASEEPSEDMRPGAGIAYAVRAAMYMDLARMYANATYGENPDAETVPFVGENTSTGDLANNPRLTNAQMWAQIISDLDKAESYLEGYSRTSNSIPDQSVVYGLKARAYLTMEDWANAEKYARLAMQSYSVMSADEYTDRNTGFNTPNGAWMWSLTYNSTDPCITGNDADTSWGSWMALEITSGCGYASNYGGAKAMDRHLYESIPATDCRKRCFLDFAIDEMSDLEAYAALQAYSDYPDQMVLTKENNACPYGGLSLKFRAAGGAEGHANQYVGFLMSVPLMRVEEMKLIEAEAVGMQSGREAEGIELLTKFAQQRDPNYVYGTHNESYGNTSTPAFQNEIWWQRRVEFWGEGLSMWDIKRLDKAVIRSYSGTNHQEGYRWNSLDASDRVNNYPSAMNYCIIQTETNYNTACTNNPAPIQPSQDSSEHSW